MKTYKFYKKIEAENTQLRIKVKEQEQRILFLENAISSILHLSDEKDKLNEEIIKSLEAQASSYKSNTIAAISSLKALGKQIDKPIWER